MLDLKFVRENPDLVKENIRKKFQDQKLPLVDEVIELDKKVRELKLEGDNLRSERNKVSQEIGKLMKEKTIDEANAKKAHVTEINNRLVSIEISGLNLMPHNQNKSVLLDSLIAGIICEEENTYDSTYKMSAGKFKKLIGKINETNLALSIDPKSYLLYGR